MSKKLLLVLPALLALTACPADLKPIEQDNAHYAFFMYNYPRMVEETPNGYTETADNLVYERKEIELNKAFSAPEVDPVRAKYDFQGWFKEKTCETEWNFETDIPEHSVFLYAKWGTAQGADYVEPEYTYPEKIITDVNYRVTGILNMPVVDNKVNLTTAAIGRLKASADDVSFAVNYERKADVTLTVATYNESSKVIHLEVSSGETWDITVIDVTAGLSVAGDSAYYEQKAVNYEKDIDIDNYHIALAGSSSMENWATSGEDMNPIVTFNHGIGGTTVEQWTDKLLQRLVMPYSPKAVVFYVGVNNIINSGRSGEQTGNALVALFNKCHEHMPNTKIFYVLINKLPSYAHYQSDFDVANQMALDYQSSHSYLTCIDAGKGLLKSNGLPHAGFFLTDGLHMSKAGYVIWGKAVKDAIIDWLG